jgi:hypothetical protein
VIEVLRGITVAQQIVNSTQYEPVHDDEDEGDD